MKKQTPSRKAPNLTSLFLEKDKRTALCELLKSIKAQYKVYTDATKDDPDNGLVCSNEMYKKCQLKRFSEDMWNSLQNEFYHTADISWNSIWRYQDDFAKFDEQGYLLGIIPEELTDWSKLVKGWYHKEWAIEVMKLIQDFNLDNREPAYTSVFKDDFLRVKNQEQFVSAIYKWTDLIYWSPWKLALLESKIHGDQ